MSTEIVQAVPVPDAAPPSSRLSPKQLQAVVYESAGLTRKEIAEYVGVSQNTIKVWRGIEDYTAEIARLKENAVAALAEPVKQLRADLVNGARDAVKTLRDQLTAEDPRGKPLYGVRNEAAKLLLQYGAEAGNPSAGTSGPGAHGPAVSLNITMGDKPPAPPVD